MHVQLGTTLDGDPVHLDTSRPSVTLLLADPGHGKTTLVRFLTRWWLARGETTVTVHARRPDEWADLSEERRLALRDLEDAVDSDPPQESSHPTHLTLIDGVDAPGLGRIPGAPQPNQLVIATATSDWLGAHLAAAAPSRCLVHRWGLLPLTSPSERGPSPELASWADHWQGRLDWGPHTRPIWPRRRGPRDFPCHRWVSATAAAAGPAASTNVRLPTTLACPRSLRR
jgi:hypothetical protein